MALVGNLVIGLSVNTKNLSKGFKAASSAIGGFVSSTGSAIGKLTALSGAIAGFAGAASIGALVGNSMKAIDELGASATKLGATVEGLSALQYAATQSDLSIETLQGGLQKLNQKMGEAVLGSVSAQDAFKTLGLDAKELDKLGATEAFKRVATQIAGLPDPAQRAAAAIDIFGRSGSELLPLLTVGGEGIAALEAEARSLGLVLSSVDVAKVKEANDAIDKLKAVITSVGNAVAIGVAPWITELTKRLLAAGANGNNASKYIIDGLQAVAIGIAYAIDSVKYFDVAWQGLKLAFSQVVWAIAEGLSAIVSITVNSINGLLEYAGIGRSAALDAAKQELEQFASAAGVAADDTKIAFGDSLNALDAPSQVDALKQMFDQIQTGSMKAESSLNEMTTPVVALSDELKKVGDDVDSLAKQWQDQANAFGMTAREAEIFKLQEAGATAEQLSKLKEINNELTAQEKLNKLQEEGDALTKSLMTPLEKQQEELAKYKELLSSGSISQETYNRATNKLNADAGMSAPVFGGSAAFGSQEAYSTLARSRSMGQADPMNQLNKLNEDQLAEQRQQTALLDKLVKKEAPEFSFN